MKKININGFSKGHSLPVKKKVIYKSPFESDNHVLIDFFDIKGLSLEGVLSAVSVNVSSE